MKPDERLEWLKSMPFFAMHAACLLVFWTGASRAGSPAGTAGPG